jgi:hypothetical protein
MQERAEVTLAEFVEKESQMLTEFERFWLKGNRQSPVAYPLRLDYPGWVAFFNSFMDSK